MEFLPYTMDDLVEGGEAQVVLPTTDTGYKSYGAGRLFLPAATNYCTNPSFETHTGGDSAIPDGCSNAHSTLVAQPTYSVVAGRLGGNAQRLQYASAGDAAKALLFAVLGTAGLAWAAGETMTVSFYIHGSLSGCTPQIKVANQAWDTIIASTTIAVTGGWTRVSATGTAPAGTTGAWVWIQIYPVDTGDTFDITIDDILIEKSPVLTPYFDGTYPDCAWTGTANASTSTRAASSLIYAAPTAFAAAASRTIAMRFAPLFATAAYTTDALLIDLNGAAMPYIEMVNDALGYYYAAASTSMLASVGLAAGSVNSLVARSANSSTVDLMLNGSAADQDAIVGAATVNTVIVGAAYTGTLQALSQIGPVVLSPSRITDAETVILDAGLTAGWGGLDLFRFFKDRGYSGTLILPLNGDSRGYVVT